MRGHAAVAPDEGHPGARDGRQGRDGSGDHELEGAIEGALETVAVEQRAGEVSQSLARLQDEIGEGPRHDCLCDRAPVVVADLEGAGRDR